MKKKLLVLSAIAILVAITVVGGSLAYFTDTDTVENTFTIGSIEIEQIEQQRDADGTKLVDYVNSGKVMIPVVGNPTDSAEDDALGMATAANYQDKVVTVKNTGENDAYVRTFIAVPKALDDAGVLMLDYESGDAWSRTATYSFTKGTVEYNAYVYTYTAVLPHTTNNVTAHLLEGVYIASDVDYKKVSDTEAAFVKNGTQVSGFNAMSEVKVLVATQGVQAEGFNTAASALDAAFGAPDTNNPF